MINSVLERTGKFLDPLGLWGERKWDDTVIDRVAQVWNTVASAFVCIVTLGLFHGAHAYFSKKIPPVETQQRIIETAKKNTTQKTSLQMIQSAQNTGAGFVISCQSLSEFTRSFGEETEWVFGGTSMKNGDQEYKTKAPYNKDEASALAEKMKSCGAEIYIAQSRSEAGVWRVVIYTKPSSVSQTPAPQMIQSVQNTEEISGDILGGMSTDSFRKFFTRLLKSEDQSDMDYCASTLRTLGLATPRSSISDITITFNRDLEGYYTVQCQSKEGELETKFVPWKQIRRLMLDAFEMNMRNRQY